LRKLGVGRVFAIQPLPGPLGRAPAAYGDLRRMMARAMLRRGRAARQTRLPGWPDMSVRAQTPRWFAGDDVQEDVVVFQPPMPRGVSILDFAKHARIMAMAREWTLREIEHLRAEGDPVFSAVATYVDEVLEENR